jgi:N-acetylneuraminic acid mutarotase
MLYLLGGYTVAEDGSEKSVPTVHALEPHSGQWSALPPMPVPVDDAVSVAYAARFIYLISGWHDSGNVNLVQVYDTRERRWFQATPFPGAAVFGHAGGIAGPTMVICDGVKVVATAARRRFEDEAACYRGAIDADDPARIEWTVLRHHPGKALYRMAAVGDDTGRIVFAGGSDNPYNFNGIGYNGRPSAPSANVFFFDLERDAWVSAGKLTQASMDHRGLLRLGENRYAIVGGMRADQQVSASTQVFELP